MIPIISVSQAIDFLNSLFETTYFAIQGEVSGYSVGRGQFVFFDLKDEEQEASINCFMMLHSLTVPLEDGMRVVVYGKPRVYPKSGKMTITVQKVEPKGEGSVKRAFEMLKKKLAEEGIFAKDRKRALPKYPRSVGIISSRDAAGYGDFMRIAACRLKGVDYYLAHSAVQGKDAEEEICFAFDHLNSHYDLDAIVLIRGGGSMEDLHAFNSEPVARAIVRSKVPVLVGVGHERDVTIADYCADLRASTPSNAAQLLLPTQEEVQAEVVSLVQRGQKLVQSRIAQFRERIYGLVKRGDQQLRHHIQLTQQRVEGLRKTIDAVSPTETLKRGYTVTCDASGGVIQSAKGLKNTDKITTTFVDGKVSSVVTES